VAGPRLLAVPVPKPMAKARAKAVVALLADAGGQKAMGKGRPQATVSVVAGVTPGSTCSTAGSIPVGGHYSGTVPGMLSSDWFTFPVTGGTQYTVTLSGVTGFSAIAQVWDGTACLGSTNVGFTSGNGSVVFTPGSTITAWVSIAGTPGAAYTLTVTSP